VFLAAFVFAVKQREEMARVQVEKQCLNEV
jgi:hypothetical protein